MADFKDYIISQQDFSGLEKLAEREEAKAASRAKAEEERKARKAATTQYLTNYLKSDDYLTGTVHDPHITEKVSELLNSGIELADKGANASEIVVALSPQATKLGRESQALKELERRRKEEEAVVKSIPGADVNLFNQGWREGIYLNPDGSLREVSSIDLSKDYGSMIRDNYPMWNNSAVDSFVSKAKPITYNKSVSVQDAKKAKRDTEIEVSSPLHMQPVIKNGIFEGDFEVPYDLYTENGKVKQMPVYENGKQKLDNQGNPVTENIKLLKKEDWTALKNDYPTYQLIRQKTRQAGVDPDTPDGDRIANAIGYDLINTTTKAKVSFSEKSKSQAAPVTNIRVSTGGTGSKEPTIRDVYADIADKLSTGQEQYGGGGRAYSYTANTLSDAGTILTDEINKRFKASGDIPAYSASELRIMESGDGKTIEVRSDREGDGGKLLLPINKRDINIKGQVTSKGKEKVIKESKTIFKGSNQKMY